MSILGYRWKDLVLAVDKTRNFVRGLNPERSEEESENTFWMMFGNGRTNDIEGLGPTFLGRIGVAGTIIRTVQKAGVKGIGKILSEGSNLYYHMLQMMGEGKLPKTMDKTHKKFFERSLEEHQKNEPPPTQEEEEDFEKSFDEKLKENRQQLDEVQRKMDEHAEKYPIKSFHDLIESGKIDEFLKQSDEWNKLYAEKKRLRVREDKLWENAPEEDKLIKAKREEVWQLEDEFDELKQKMAENEDNKGCEEGYEWVQCGTGKMLRLNPRFSELGGKILCTRVEHTRLIENKEIRKIPEDKRTAAEQFQLECNEWALSGYDESKKPADYDARYRDLASLYDFEKYVKIPENERKDYQKEFIEGFYSSEKGKTRIEKFANKNNEEYEKERMQETGQQPKVEPEPVEAPVDKFNIKIDLTPQGQDKEMGMT